MSKFKRLITDLVESDDDIFDLLKKTREATPSSFELLFKPSLLDESKRQHLYNFTDDKELVALIITGINMDLIDPKLLKLVPIKLTNINE